MPVCGPKHRPNRLILNDSVSVGHSSRPVPTQRRRTRKGASSTGFSLQGEAVGLMGNDNRDYEPLPLAISQRRDSKAR